MRELLNQYVIVYGILGCTVAEVFAKFVVGHTLGRWVKASKDMAHTKHRFLKAICMKFETCYRLKIGVPNVELFIEKYMRSNRILGLHIQTWDAFCNLCSILITSGSLIGTLVAILLKLSDSVVFLTLISGVAGLGITMIFETIFGEARKISLLKMYIQEYLQNMYKPRLENEVFHPDLVKKYQNEYFSDADTGKKENVVELAAKKELADMNENNNPGMFNFTEEEEEVIREVLREYMG